MNKLFMLSQINLLDELPHHQLEEINEMTSSSPIKKGTMILSPNHEMRSLYFLKKGQVRLYKLSPSGKEFTVDILGQGNIFGETSSFSLSEDHIYAQTMVDSYICTLSKVRFEELLRKRSDLSLKLISILSK
ncbi:Crp/Fnr family transcriptional regulator [Bacillus coahuilensis]|uniref:Crp/Fnr family transcriptional regulator n=1 Tax=Bacillus coahuilensis TaxID=408580 RepID=UPI000B326DB5|nr:cyclic nucleotide-binding domain-containing protein [Bacillus coahuilensis]